MIKSANYRQLPLFSSVQFANLKKQFDALRQAFSMTDEFELRRYKDSIADNEARLLQLSLFREIRQ